MNVSVLRFDRLSDERLLLVLKRRIDTGEKVLIVSLVLGRSGRPAGRGQCLDLVQEHDPASVTLIDRKDAYAFLVRAFALAKVDVIASAPHRLGGIFINIGILSKRLGKHRLDILRRSGQNLPLESLFLRCQPASGD